MILLTSKIINIGGTMKFKTNKILTLFMVVILFFVSNPVIYAANSSPLLPDAAIYLYDESSPLYAATNFHIFTISEVNIGSVHTNGNIATTLFNGTANFGTNNVTKDITYLKNIQSFSSSTKASTLVLGQNVETTYYDNNNKIALIIGQQIIPLGNIPKENIRLDNTGNFIDFENEFSKLTQLSTYIANLERTVGHKEDFADENKRTITLQPKVLNIIDIDYSILSQSRDIYIREYYPTEGTTLLINVDLKNLTNAYISSKTNFFVGSEGRLLNNAERSDFSENTIIWNFYDSTQSDSIYRGNLDIIREFLGTILAPRAYVSTHSNFDGTVIATTYANKGGETHRWDFNGVVPTPIPSTTPIPTVTEVPVEPTTTPIPTVTEVPIEPTTTPIPTVTEVPVEPTTTPIPTVTEVPVEPTTSPTPTVTEVPIEPTTTPVPTVTEVPVEPTTSPTPTVTEVPVEPTTTPIPTVTEVPVEPTTSPTPTVTEVPIEPTTSPTPTVTPVPTSTPIASPTPEPTTIPIATPTPEPTTTTAPTVTPEPIITIDDDPVPLASNTDKLPQTGEYSQGFKYTEIGLSLIILGVFIINKKHE
jgi:choice-of-anchor A domain-containing protein